ncbi:MAG: zinc-dependent peptidase [Bacteroidia bacterium]|nr:zinc-dependent peptidase [Bacteroidia bacterium]
MALRDWKNMFRRQDSDHASFLGEVAFRHEYLLVYSAYYRELTPRLQVRFQQRLSRILRKLRFYTTPAFPLQPEMVALVAGAIVQVTFGLKRFIPTYFTEIYITPASYTYPSRQVPMKGDVNLDTGIMTLSWPAVKEGFLIEDDAQNTALHEVSHCLDLETTFFGKEGYFFDQTHWEDWEKKALQRLANQSRRMVSKRTHHSKMKELFANTVEIFFERPEALLQLSPAIYGTMCQLLGQDPRRKESPIL